MTQVGHTLTGIAIGILSVPAGNAAQKQAAYWVAFALLANIPDFPFRNWGHDRYDVSHSLLVNLLLVGAIAFIVLFWSGTRTRTKGWSVVAGGAAAWLSHLLLDSFYTHGYGIAILWPVSDARLALPIPWFSTVNRLPPPFTSQTIRVFWIEFVSYFPLIVIAALIRRKRVARLIGSENRDAGQT